MTVHDQMGWVRAAADQARELTDDLAHHATFEAAVNRLRSGALATECAASLPEAYNTSSAPSLRKAA